MQALVTEWISARKATHLHKSPHTPGLLMRKISKSQPFSDSEYLFGNKTLLLFFHQLYYGPSINHFS